MDIKPFIAPEHHINFWLDKHSLWFIMLGIVMLMALIALILRRGTKQGNETRSIMIPSCIGVGILFLYVGVSSVAYAEKAHAEMDAYDAYLTEVEDKLEKEGFTIGAKKPHLRPGYETPVTLTYKNKDYACTVVTPTDTNANVDFSCSEANLNLNQIKESK